MSARFWYLLSADVVLVVHFAFVLFVVLGLAAIWIGWFCKWKAVRNVRFRVAHLACMGVVVLESVFGVVCPLTTWEKDLRFAAGSEVYEETSMKHWAQGDVLRIAACGFHGDLRRVLPGNRAEPDRGEAGLAWQVTGLRKLRILRMMASGEVDLRELPDDLVNSKPKAVAEARPIGRGSERRVFLPVHLQFAIGGVF